MQMYSIGKVLTANTESCKAAYEVYDTFTTPS